jgi:hypothetical protein
MEMFKNDGGNEEEDLKVPCNDEKPHLQGW